MLEAMAFLVRKKYKLAVCHWDIICQAVLTISSSEKVFFQRSLNLPAKTGCTAAENVNENPGKAKKERTQAPNLSSNLLINILPGANLNFYVLPGLVHF